MTAVPVPPAELLSIEDYVALGEIEHGRYELMEGRLLVSPSPAPTHMIAVYELCARVKEQLPRSLRVVPDVDLDLEFARPGEPGWSRRPDLLVVTEDGLARANREDGLLRASEVVVVAEVVSPGSERTDFVTKRAEYAAAGIPQYWIADLRSPVSLMPCRLDGDSGGYQDPGGHTGPFTTMVADHQGNRFPVRLDPRDLLD
ncbi:Uma2 family endonuclease [Amycolatopsis samaneae]|uniref:Uma2 family endonuclease n=1 Tax=Amycolatopsis samaneae TaxID=664691 RepID=A0ABW5GBA6_9PSEU